MADYADNFIAAADYTTGTVTFTAETHIPPMPFPLQAAARVAALGGPETWRAWLQSQPFPPNVRAWHTAGMDAARREGLRLAVAAFPLIQPA